MLTILPALALAGCPIDLDPGSRSRLEQPGHYGWHEVWIPEDFDPGQTWPVIAYYHGFSDELRPNALILQAVTEGHGFIIVGMDYGSARYYQALEDIGLRREERRWRGMLDDLEACFEVDRDALFLAGYSQGGYAVTNLGERLLDELAGIIVLGAGRGWGDGHMPNRELIDRFPIFVAAGADDQVHGARARGAAGTYARWGAVVSLERWADTDHIEGWRWYMDAPERAANLREWLHRYSGTPLP